jgi:hypothetical protein
LKELGKTRPNGGMMYFGADEVSKLGFFFPLSLVETQEEP